MISSHSKRRGRPLIQSHAFLLALIAGIGLSGAGVAGAAKQTFKPFNYVAAPTLSNPGAASQACLDLGVPTCPAGHTCTIFGYSGTGSGSPNFGKTNIEVCIEQDQSIALPNGTGGSCFASSGFAQIAFRIKPKHQEVFDFGLVGQTCQFNGADTTANLTQNMTLTTQGVAGTLSISSLVTNGTNALLSIYGVEQNLL